MQQHSDTGRLTETREEASSSAAEGPACLAFPLMDAATHSAQNLERCFIEKRLIGLRNNDVFYFSRSLYIYIMLLHRALKPLVMSIHLQYWRDENISIILASSLPERPPVYLQVARDKLCSRLPGASKGTRRLGQTGKRASHGGAARAAQRPGTSWRTMVGVSSDG